MAIAEIPVELTTELLGSVGKLGLYLQAIGAIIIIWLGFSAIDLVLSHRMKKQIAKNGKKIDLLIHKIDALSKK